MISNERPSPYRTHPVKRAYNSHMPPKPRMEEKTINIQSIEIERKTFVFTLKENDRGRFLRITESVQGRFNNLIIPASRLEEFSKIVEGMALTADEIQPK